MVIKHFKLLKKYDGDKKAILLIRPHIARYFKDIPNHKTITKQLVLENNCDKFLQILQGLNK
jgi:tRNA-dihydrouridine synthase